MKTEGADTVPPERMRRINGHELEKLTTKIFEKMRDLSRSYPAICTLVTSLEVHSYLLIKGYIQDGKINSDKTTFWVIARHDTAQERFYFSPYTPEELAVLTQHPNSGIIALKVGGVHYTILVENRLQGLSTVNAVVPVLYERIELVEALLRESIGEFSSNPHLHRNDTHIDSVESEDSAQEYSVDTIFSNALSKSRQERLALHKSGN